MKKIVLNPELIDLIAVVDEEGVLDSVLVNIYGIEIDITLSLFTPQMERIELSVETELQIEKYMDDNCDSYDAHREMMFK
jgi:hypothetical protein